VDEDDKDELTEFDGSLPSPSGASTPRQVLQWAVDLARYAPSLYNAQPWSWRVGTDNAELFMDVTRSFPVTDPDRREMRISCGAALHHLEVALAAAGWRWELERSPDLEGTGLLARVRLTERGDVDRQSLQWVGAITRRHTDRRPFSTRAVDSDAQAALQSCVEADGVHLQIVTQSEHHVWLAVLASKASEQQVAQEGYAAELASVRCESEPSANIHADAVPHVVSPRHSDVPLRDFELSDLGTLPIPESVDEHPVWCILWTDRDTRLEWLSAGEALSRLLLTATDRGLAAGVQSQPVEVPWVRAMINRHLLSNLGHAQVVVRVGWAHSDDSELPASPRRPIDDVTSRS